MDKFTAGNTRGQLVGSGVWVQVAEIFTSGRKIQKLVASTAIEASSLAGNIHHESHMSG
jgi:hypothetical protein